jgi:hypothetical protein
VQGPDRLAGGQRGVGGVGGGTGALGVQRDHRVDPVVERVDARQAGVGQLARGQLPGADQRGQLGRGPEAQLVVHQASLPR